MNNLQDHIGSQSGSAYAGLAPKESESQARSTEKHDSAEEEWFLMIGQIEMIPPMEMTSPMKEGCNLPHLACQRAAKRCS